jgi:hypothetical protein
MRLPPVKTPDKCNIKFIADGLSIMFATFANIAITCMKPVVPRSIVIRDPLDGIILQPNNASTHPSQASPRPSLCGHQGNRPIICPSCWDAPVIKLIIDSPRDRVPCPLCRRPITACHSPAKAGPDIALTRLLSLGLQRIVPLHIVFTVPI